MTTRRNFLKAGSLSLAGLMVGEKMLAAVAAPEEKKESYSKLAAKVTGDFTTKRPAPADRKFSAKAVEEKIKAVKAKIKDPKLAWMFENCIRTPWTRHASSRW